MPIKSGKLKGELTIQELRELLNQQKIKYGKSLSRPKLIVSLGKQGITLQNNKLVRSPQETVSVKEPVQSAKIKTFQITSKKAKVKVKKEPVKKEPVKKEPVKKEPVKKEPVKKEPVKKEPVKKEPVKKEPVKKEVKNKK